MTRYLDRGPLDELYAPFGDRLVTLVRVEIPGPEPMVLATSHPRNDDVEVAQPAARVELDAIEELCVPGDLEVADVRDERAVHERAVDEGPPVKEHDEPGEDPAPDHDERLREHVGLDLHDPLVFDRDVDVAHDAPPSGAAYADEDAR